MEQDRIDSSTAAVTVWLLSRYIVNLSYLILSPADRARSVAGDSKESVRDKAHILLIMLMLHTVTPQHMLEKLTPAFSHKLAKVREEVMVLLQNALAE